MRTREEGLLTGEPELLAGGTRAIIWRTFQAELCSAKLQYLGYGPHQLIRLNYKTHQMILQGTASTIRPTNHGTELNMQSSPACFSTPPPPYGPQGP